LESHSQVGIGTNSPDASSILDLTSTTQGILTPRMTTAQRIAISSPADGLLVFDTDVNVFYFYSGGNWKAFDSETKRNNYKLIKSIADLADELVAGGGAKYLLNSEYLYEINGTILVDFPIDLNDAFILGLNNRKDILFNNSGTTLFSGIKGGNFRSVTIVGNGQTIFDITGTGVENVIFNQTNFIGSSKVGTLSNLNIVFFNIGQLSNNLDGISISDVDSFFMVNEFWNSTNTGTFINLSGTFNDVQILSGNITADTGETGLNISSNPTITGAGSISNVDFSGNGTHVNGYTTGTYPGFKFSNEWIVRSPGLNSEGDEVSTGSLYVTIPVETNIAAANTPIKVAGTTTGLNFFRTSSPVDNRLVYKGTKTRFFSYTVSMSVTAASNNKNFSFYLAKNGVILPESMQRRKIATGADIGSISLSGVVEMATNDYIEIWVENINDATDITAESLNLIIK